MTPAETLTLGLYFFVLIILAFYGWHRYYLVYAYMKNKDRQPKAGPQLSPLPAVTIQLPLYNEMYVADRLVDAVCQIDYPRELLEIGPTCARSRNVKQGRPPRPGSESSAAADARCSGACAVLERHWFSQTSSSCAPRL